MIELTKHTFDELSILKYEIYTCPFIKDPQKEALIISFRGEYSVGSGGNGDARFMAAIVTAALTVWRCRALILDLSAMHYEWGDAILDVIYMGRYLYRYAPFPTALLVSNLN